MRTERLCAKFRRIPRSVLALIGVTLLLFAGGADGSAPPIETGFAETYQDDLTAFKRLRAALFERVRETEISMDQFGPDATSDKALLRPEIRAGIRRVWFLSLDTYLALDVLVDKYAGFHRLRDKEERQRSFDLYRSVFLTQYRGALDLISRFDRTPLIDTILNEADPALGLPAGLYAHFKYRYLNVAKAGHFAALEAVAPAFGEPKDPELAGWVTDDRRMILGAGAGPGPLMTMKNGLAILADFGQSAWFPVQKGVAEWMGQTKVWRPHHYLISPRQIEQDIAGRVMPGDILLERREWYMTNVGIPGFWTHAALYVGSADERAELSRDAAVAAWLSAQGAATLDELIEKHFPEASAGLQTPYRDGNSARVIEALSPGVLFTSLEYSARCDSLAVLRPRLSKRDRAAAVVRAMLYYGRPYDYNFDFASDRSLVCTELIVKAYLTGPGKQGLDLPLTEVMGHMVTPANGFVEFFDQTFGSNSQQLDLVLFLDGSEKEQRARESGVETFRKTWTRPKYHILIHDFGSEPEAGKR